jgi:molybdopterin-guanine dinucleotide biosynthesis protein A
MEIPESSFPAIAGVIMAGGLSSRFGSNKALALFHNKPVIQHVAETISPLFPTCLLSTNTPEAYTFLGLSTVKDIYPNAGPLGGIHAALSAIDQPRCFVVGCDMPLIDPKLVRFLCTLAEEQDDRDVVLPWLASGPEPLCAVYSQTGLPVIEKDLIKRNLKLSDTVSELRVRRVKEEELLASGADLSTFRNINRPEDLADITGS